MIRSIEGSARFDVSGKLHEMLCDTLSMGAEKIFLIVPDQFEFETEKTIYGVLDKNGLLTGLSKINVTTFSSLSREILASAGENMPAADDVVKSVIMNKAVREQKNSLSVLRGASDKTGFCGRMIDTINALKTAGLSAADLGEDSGLFLADSEKSGINPLLKKLSDVGKIYVSYDSLLSKYADSLDYIKKASELISKQDNAFFENSCVFVDCFNDFTGSQMEFISRMTAKAKDVVFAFVLDTKDEPRENVFGRIFAQRDRIIGFAEKENIKTEIVYKNIGKRLCDTLGELSEKIFSNDRSEIDPSGFCELVSARDVYEEADYTAAKIKQLCLDKGMLYRETAVLCADAGYGKYVRDAFERYDIPFFLDIPEPILYQPIVSFFVSLLNALRNFTPDNILSCVKTGFYGKPNADNTGVTAISNKDIDVFESYIFEWNLSTKHLKSEFKFGSENDPNRIEAEKIRKAVAEPIITLRDELKNKDGAQITRLLYDFAANKIGIERALLARCYGNDSAFDEEAVRVNRQIWSSLVEIIEVLESELSGENISLEEYFRLFTDICANTALAQPPQYRDCVLVGDIDRTRADGVKAVFIVGASYDSFPAAASGMGIFSEYESELVTNLIRKNTDTDDLRAQSLKNFKEQYSLSLYRAYRAVSLPTEFLSISCPEYDASGNKLSRSTVFSDIRRVFPNIKTIRTDELSDAFYCRSIKAVKQRYSMSLDGSSPLARAMRGYLETNNADFVQKLDEIHDRRNLEKQEGLSAHKLSENSAKQLFKLSHERYDNRFSIGATRVEKLISCPFSYFCASELGIHEITKREFNGSNRGNALHYVMQRIFTQYRGKTDEFFKLKRGDFTALAGRYLTEYLKIYTNGDFEDDRRTVFLFKNIASSAADLLVTMQTELSVKSYQPQFFELNISNESINDIFLNIKEFNGNLPAENGSTQSGRNEDTQRFELLSKPLSIKLQDETEIFVGGKLDRLDVMYAEKDAKPRMYLRVIDYKTSAKIFDKENAKKGANIQMLLYLTALCAANSENKTIEVLPGEISYIPSKNAGAAKNRGEALYLLETKLRPNGLYINDEFIENNLKNVSEKIAAGITSDNEILRQKIIEDINKSFALNSENAATPEEFKELSEECVNTVREKLSMLYSGDVSAEPLIYKDSAGNSKSEHTPCDHCDFYGICGNSKKQRS